MRQGFSPATIARIAAAPRRHAIFATLITGFLDAVGYAQLGHLYVSFMSGNSTQLGMALASQWSSAPLIVLIIGSFVGGATIGTLIAEADARLTTVTVLGAELLAFLIAITLVLFGYDRIGLAFVAVAMGMQNNLHQVIVGADVGKGFITGALFALGPVAGPVFFKGKAKIGQAASNALSWTAFVSGVVIGACTVASMGVLGSLIIVAGLVFITIGAICVGWL